MQVSQLLDRLLEGRVPPVNSRIAKAQFSVGVQRTDEWERIQKIPRRAAPPELPDLTPVFAREGGKLALWPLQNWALWEAERAGGLFGIMPCGGGKTLTAALLPDVLGAKRAVLLLKPGLRAQFFEVDVPFYGAHFTLPLDRITVLTYFELSSPGGTAVLDEIQPDLIIADECHTIASFTSARGRRFNRFMETHPETRFCGLSGTVTKRSIVDYAHLLRYALKDRCPVPSGRRELEDWARALDAGEAPMPPGVLLDWVTPRTYQLQRGQGTGGLVVDGDRIVEAAPIFRSLVGKTVSSAAPDAVPVPPTQTEVRTGYQRRLRETEGVVSSSEAEVGASLIVKRLRTPEVPSEVRLLMEQVRATGKIDDEELEDPMAVGRVLRQLAVGFHYVWRWPGGVKDWDWLSARAAWHREIRERLVDAPSGLDSPFLLATAASTGRIQSEAWPAWAAQKQKPEPPVEPVWTSDFAVDAAIEWARLCSAEFPGIVWYEHDAFGRRVADKGGLPFYGPGEEASARILKAEPRREPAIVASIAAHGEGKNLQAYSYALVTTPPASGLKWEQLCSRLHRPGQEADEVTFDVVQHVPEYSAAFDQAVADARYVFETSGSKQKLLIARIVEEDE